jgi:hypothetical protein
MSQHENLVTPDQYRTEATEQTENEVNDPHVRKRVDDRFAQSLHP